MTRKSNVELVSLQVSNMVLTVAKAGEHLVTVKSNVVIISDGYVSEAPHGDLILDVPAGVQNTLVLEGGDNVHLRINSIESEGTNGGLNLIVFSGTTMITYYNTFPDFKLQVSSMGSVTYAKGDAGLTSIGVDEICCNGVLRVTTAGDQIHAAHTPSYFATFDTLKLPKRCTGLFVGPSLEEHALRIPGGVELGTCESFCQNMMSSRPGSLKGYPLLLTPNYGAVVQNSNVYAWRVIDREAGIYAILRGSNPGMCEQDSSSLQEVITLTTTHTYKAFGVFKITERTIMTVNNCTDIVVDDFLEPTLCNLGELFNIPWNTSPGLKLQSIEIPEYVRKVLRKSTILNETSKKETEIDNNES